MALKLLVLTCFFLVAFAILNEASSPKRRTVKIDSGKIRGNIQKVKGISKAKVVTYLSVKYAEAKRFELPHPPKGWNKTLKADASARGKWCIQENFHIFESEDCLTLNVYVPEKQAKKKNKPYAVMVWIHGGVLVKGNKDFQDGLYLAALGDVIVVTMNYRLGILGFLAGPANSKLSIYKGNYGLYDQIEALRWVKRNIAK